MKIGIDMLADQSAGRDRGTGRYTRALLVELSRQSRHELLLYYHDGLPRSSADLGGRTTSCTLPIEDSLHSGIDRLARANPDNLDVILLTCPLENFHGYLPPFPSRRGPKLAAVIYDLIPLRFPEQYLGHPDIAQSYRRALAAVRHYDLLLTISDSSRQDVIELLGVAPERATNISAGCDGLFCAPTSPSPDSDAMRWLSSQGIDQPFVYAITALDYRKNLSGLLAAFERLPSRLLDSHQLVITCAASSADDVRRVRSAIDRSSVAKRMVLTDRLDDEGLRTLYQHAAAFVFPSRYEGFGLPIVEAMRCGAPVVAGNNSSQIEVVGDAGLLANVDDADDLANKISSLLENRRLADNLAMRAVEQARRFTWPAVTRRCLDALERTIARPRQSTWFDTLAARGRLAVESRLERYASHLRRATA